MSYDYNMLTELKYYFKAYMQIEVRGYNGS